MVTKGYGITIQQIDDSCPKDLEIYEAAHEQEVIEKDRLNHCLGMYMMSAFSTTLSNAFQKHSKAQYAKKPILAKMLEEAGKIKSPESNEECAVFEMKQRINILRMQGLPESPL